MPMRPGVPGRVRVLGAVWYGRNTAFEAGERAADELADAGRRAERGGRVEHARTGESNFLSEGSVSSNISTSSRARPAQAGGDQARVAHQRRGLARDGDRAAQDRRALPQRRRSGSGSAGVSRRRAGSRCAAPRAVRAGADVRSSRSAGGQRGERGVERAAAVDRQRRGGPVGAAARAAPDPPRPALERVDGARQPADRAGQLVAVGALRRRARPGPARASAAGALRSVCCRPSTASPRSVSDADLGQRAGGCCADVRPQDAQRLVERHVVASSARAGSSRPRRPGARSGCRATRSTKFEPSNSVCGRIAAVASPCSVMSSSSIELDAARRRPAARPRRSCRP